ncbi:hypothetical protein B0H13DRAFT_1885545 [Mycena leptocephala]|nr:hypothetical protein B0H13DRAFT_1885545 [Mycena leptocephala]
MSNIVPMVYMAHAASFRLRGGSNSDGDDSEDNGTFIQSDESDEPDSNSAGPSSKRKKKTRHSHLGPESDQVRAKFWDVSAHRFAIILDVSDTPECLQGDRKLMSVDAYIKKQCQDAWTGPTGSKKTGLALVIILDEGKDDTMPGFYTCSFASPDHLLGFECWDVESDTDTQELISGPMFESKNAKGTDIVAIATAFYRSMTNQHCKAKGDGSSQFECGGHAVMRKYRTGKSSGKHYFIGCSNWSDGDGLSHRFTKIPPQVRESILRSLFRGEEIVEEDTEVVEGYCSAIIHPSHLPRNKECDLRAVVIPKAGVPHNHPAFVRAKTPFQVAQKYKKAAETTGVIGQTTLRIDKRPAQERFLTGRSLRKYTQAWSIIGNGVKLYKVFGPPASQMAPE